MSHEGSGFTFAFVDLAGFTALTEAHGDHDAADLIDRFETLTRDALGTDDLVSVASSHSAMIAADPEMRGHQHELLGCLWLLVAGLALLIAHALTRLRATSRDPVAVIRNLLSTTQRAPPTSVRLRLMGVSRR